MINDDLGRKEGGSAVKGVGNRGKGRKKGVLNKTTAKVKEMILEALSDVGGKDYLVRQADENPVAFMSLLGKVLPSEIKADLNHSGQIAIKKIERVIVNPEN